jgi:cytochrome c-type biogenesis protein CcmH
MSRTAFPIALMLLATFARPSWAQERLPLAAPDASVVVGVPSGPPRVGDRLDAATKEIASLLRCPVCQGSSVWDSPATMAVNMKRQVRDLLADGYSQDQVLQYFKSSYGEFVLLAPPKNGIALVVWILPAVFLVFGAGVIWRLIARAPVSAPEPPAVIAAAVSSPRKGVTKVVRGLVLAGVIVALLLLANAAATSRAPAVRTVDPSATESGFASDPQAQHGGGRVTGVIELDSSAASSVIYPAVVFVYARLENVSVGPPLAALRLQVSSFPVEFSLGPEHAMTGGTLPRKVRIEARIDPDGNVTTREPDARHGFIDRVELGATNLRILLK